MRLTIGSRLGGGAFGDVYEAVDELDRQLAVKIIRGSAAQLSSALDHAKALARAQHPNVVAILSLERIADPTSGDEVDAIVMERLDGQTLTKRLDSARLAIDDARAIGVGIVEGLGHIHDEGLAHGDLHPDNVIVSKSIAKIIDILYTDSLALLSTAPKDARRRRDLLSLRMMLHDMLLRSECDPAVAADFNATLGNDPGIAEIREALIGALDPARKDDVKLHVQEALRRLQDDEFVEGLAYAHALYLETPKGSAFPLLNELVSLSGIHPKHRHYLRLVWGELTDAEKDRLTSSIARKIDSEVPKGQWGTSLNLLLAFGKEGWDRLPPRCRMRLEGAIVNDILAGHHDIFNTLVRGRGNLGTYVIAFWRFFEDLDRLVDMIAARLSSDWYGQNYIGRSFLELLPQLGSTPNRREKLINGLASAVRNDARLIVARIHELPEDWQEEIRKRTR